MVGKNLKISVPIALILGSLVGLNRAKSPDVGNLAIATGCVGLALLAIEIISDL